MLQQERHLSLDKPPFCIKKKPKSNYPLKDVQLRFLLAQRKGFEPLDTFLHHTISNRARSTTPPSLHKSVCFKEQANL